jgi:hypothetical protein
MIIYDDLNQNRITTIYAFYPFAALPLLLGRGPRGGHAPPGRSRSDGVARGESRLGGWGWAVGAAVIANPVIFTTGRRNLLMSIPNPTAGSMPAQRSIPHCFTLARTQAGLIYSITQLLHYSTTQNILSFPPIFQQNALSAR